MFLGQEVFSFNLPDLEGNPFSISEYRGKMVLIFMWSSW